METELASFFNEISLKSLDQTDNLDLNNICMKLDELHDRLGPPQTHVLDPYDPQNISINLTFILPQTLNVYVL